MEEWWLFYVDVAVANAEEDMASLESELTAKREYGWHTWWLFSLFWHCKCLILYTIVIFVKINVIVLIFCVTALMVKPTFNWYDQ